MKRNIIEKIYRTTAISAGLYMVASCGFLTLDESVYTSVEYQFSTFDNVKKVTANVYSWLLSGYSDVEGTMIDAASDDAVYAWPDGTIKKFYDGSWNAGSAVDDEWSWWYSAIAQANYFLENCPDDFPEAIYQERYKENKEQLDNYPYEIRALRAYFHFELLRRYRNIIIADRQFTPEEAGNLVPAGFDEAAAWIAGECDEAALSLPDTYKGTYAGETARVTRGMARALKSRVLLYAASPLNNPENDTDKWLAAAAAAKTVIDSGVYSLVDEEVVNNVNAAGLIFTRYNTADNSVEMANYPVGYQDGQSGVCPTMNLVEAFDMIDGTPFDWNNPQHREAVLDPSMRDPRLARTVFMNGMAFRETTIQSYTGGMNGLPKDGASPTSFYMRKHLKEDTDLTVGSTTSYQHYFPLMRYAEVVLNYAEALFEATGEPDFTGMAGGVAYTLSPRMAVNMVRLRAGMPGISETAPDAFRERVRRERRVELALEGHRFWDIRRWKSAEGTTGIYGLTVTRHETVTGTDEYGKPAVEESFTAEKTLVQSRIWEDRMYWYPIADTELYKNANLVQNPGW
ncbi:MAG: RagB/SusD family nutrient uptake outer membrane protein [Clostridium sp.]|nr:RagB/SusD family nutrient uptake outer membrane protein [Bacteroides sp.]MCM1197359.1 RagB/SusD family nutrient uptake outer membrane protein [Clostridium sp.]